jgi:hypothetical protein
MAQPRGIRRATKLERSNNPYRNPAKKQLQQHIQMGTTTSKKILMKVKSEPTERNRKKYKKFKNNNNTTKSLEKTEATQQNQHWGHCLLSHVPRHGGYALTRGGHAFGSKWLEERRPL